MIVVVDASVAVKWFVEEDRRDKAREILAARNIRIAPEILFSEAANAFRKKVSKGEITGTQAFIALNDLPKYFAKTVPDLVLVNEALRLSLELSHPVADCLYLACAEHVGGRLVSDDIKFLSKCLENYAGFIVSLSDWVHLPEPKVDTR